ncbi:MAG TPA: hypothetical protein VEY67_12900, partial [Candidatus Dormibacteraeota bacterium]|nr:hypothetical protein [Candidatus Dormibacteraeota bacterium]
MTAATARMDALGPRPAQAAGAWARRNTWTLGLLGLLAILLVFTKLINPDYGRAGIQGLGISVLPLGFAAAAQTFVVI